MQIPDLLRIYQAKTDEELIDLAASPEQLTHDARISLMSEVSRRGIQLPFFSQPIESDVETEQHRSQTTAQFVVEVVRTYHANFWLFFKISAPAVIVSMIAYVAARAEVREILRSLPRGPALLAYRFEILEIGLWNYFSYLVSWVAFSLSFAAICTAVHQVSTGSKIQARNAFTDLRQRLAPFLRLSLFLFFLMLIAQAASLLLSSGVLRILHQLGIQTHRLTISLISYGCIGLGFLVLSRFALAIPALVLDQYHIGKAMFRSDELTQGKWLILASLLAKSLIGSYVAALWPFWLVANIDLPIVLPSWFPWILTLASATCVTAVEPTMFVGFALLYLKNSRVSSRLRDTGALQVASP